jgi:hypothetical protein
MTKPQSDDNQLPAESLRQRLFCIIDSTDDCENAVESLRANGFDGEHFEVLRGEQGVERFGQFMEGKQWGASAEDVYHDGLSALHDGSSLLFVEAPTREDAANITQLLKPHNAREVFHFGDLVDTRLTA